MLGGKPKDNSIYDSPVRLKPVLQHALDELKRLTGVPGDTGMPNTLYLLLIVEILAVRIEKLQKEVARIDQGKIKGNLCV